METAADRDKLADTEESREFELESDIDPLDCALLNVLEDSVDSWLVDDSPLAELLVETLPALSMLIDLAGVADPLTIFTEELVDSDLLTLHEPKSNLLSANDVGSMVPLARLILCEANEWESDWVTVAEFEAELVDSEWSVESEPTVINESVSLFAWDCEADSLPAPEVLWLLKSGWLVEDWLVCEL